MKLFSLGFVAALVLLAAGVYGACALGLAPVSTKAPPLPFERQLTRIALNAREDKEAPKEAPFAASPEVFAAGATTYRSYCAPCHGVPGQGRPVIAQGMFPGAPQFFNMRNRPGKKKMGPDGQPRSGPRPTSVYWAATTGIRLTGMPSFKDTLTDQQIWEVSLLLSNAAKLPPQIMTTLQVPLKDKD